jgi:15-cis-phytoene synthase
MSNFDHCAALVRDADRDRYLATLFAPAGHRDALFAIYAFNVEIARVRDLAREPMPGEIRLQWWREVLSGARDGEAAAHPVAAALQATLARYGIAGDQLVALIDAHVFDLYDDPMARVNDLERYGRDTQGALFALAAGILGADTEAVATLTRHAGMASAIAGALRAFALHATRRQLYLPLELLERHEVDRESIFAGRADDSLRAALADMRGHARRHLAAARAELKTAPPEILPALLPAAVIGPTLGRMQRRGRQPFAFNEIPLWRRQWLIWRAARNPDRIFK